MAEAPGTPEADGRAGPGWFAVTWADAPVGLDLRIDSGSLHTMRSHVRACAGAAGLPDDQVEEVVLAIHELAANVVRHGGGTGRLRSWDSRGTLCFQVDDGSKPPLDGGAGADGPGGAGGSGGSGGQAGTDALPLIAGHGLWVVERICSHMITRSGPGGTSVVVAFDRPGT